MRLLDRFVMVIARTPSIREGGKLEAYPANYKQPFPETFSGQIYHPLTRYRGITQEIIAAFRI